MPSFNLNEELKRVSAVRGMALKLNLCNIYYIFTLYIIYVIYYNIIIYINITFIYIML